MNKNTTSQDDLTEFFIVAEDPKQGRIEEKIRGSSPQDALRLFMTDFPGKNRIRTSLKFADVYKCESSFAAKQRPLLSLYDNTSECEEIRRAAEERVRALQLNQLRGFMHYFTGSDIMGEKWSY